MEIIRTVGAPKPSSPVGSVLNVHFAGDTRITDDVAHEAFKLTGPSAAAYDALLVEFAGQTSHAVCQRRADLVTWHVEIPYTESTRDDVLARITEIVSQFNLAQE